MCQALLKVSEFYSLTPPCLSANGAEHQEQKVHNLPWVPASDSGDPGGSQNSLSGEQVGVSASGVSKLSVESELPRGGKE